ncbi:MAG: S-methyl-5-thioribose-1-phosphate isomerase [Bacteroidetes bacterium]|nr:MAG: S-methyl-5-thioribose-1-phosphate isomerase [Bacteroidota bacterium]
MQVQGKNYRTIWLDENNENVYIIDQRFLPHRFVIEEISTVDQMVVAIKDMHLRGAGLLGAAAGYGIFLAAKEAAPTGDFENVLNISAKRICEARPTAVNPEWAVKRQMQAISQANSIEEKIKTSFKTAELIADEDAECCRMIGRNGFSLLKQIAETKKGKTLNILTHCNAGWLAFVDYGSATAPIYEAFSEGIDLHVWVDETRPRNQGASLTAWELLNQQIPHTIITDNAGGYLMQQGMVDLVITGADRVTRQGDAANKIGTYLKALAAKDNNVPFYVALPSSTFDWNMRDGVKEIPIEQRDPAEIKFVSGLNDGEIKEVLITPADSAAANYGFDITPSRLINGLITERGICKANENDILNLFPEKMQPA